MKSSTEIAETLVNKADVNAAAYKRNPWGSNATMAMAVRPITPEGTVRIWSGHADVEVIPDKRKRQAVLIAQEGDRTISRNVRFNLFGSDRPSGWAVRSAAMGRFDVELPDGATRKWHVTNMTTRQSEIYNNNWDVRAKVSVDLGSSETAFLIGMDETYHFIAQLPSAKVSSVKEAHDILRPKAANKPDTLRQGEWFFVPVGDIKAESIDKQVKDGKGRVGESPLHASARIDWSSSHRALQSIMVDGKQYVCGWIVDSRDNHHAPIWLPEWHEVVRNREVVSSRAVSSRRSWD